MNIYLSVPLSVDYVPVPVPQPKPVNIRTRGARVRILTGTGTDDLNFIHGLPVSITKYASVCYCEGSGIDAVDLYLEPFLVFSEDDVLSAT